MGTRIATPVRALVRNDNLNLQLHTFARTAGTLIRHGFAAPPSPREGILAWNKFVYFSVRRGMTCHARERLRFRIGFVLS
jgi:hypothetical protein